MLAAAEAASLPHQGVPAAEENQMSTCQEPRSFVHLRLEHHQRSPVNASLSMLVNFRLAVTSLNIANGPRLGFAHQYGSTPFRTTVSSDMPAAS